MAADGEGNVEVLNDTGFLPLFRRHAARGISLSMRRTDDRCRSLPAEAKFLKAHDGFQRALANIVDMPDRTADLLFSFLRQNDGKLSQRGRDKEFEKLREDEVAKIKSAYADAFAD